MAADKPKRDILRLPVVSLGAEFLVMGYLMRRNILAYKAPPHNEGYDIICIHPEARYEPKESELARVRIQVKSRYSTDCDRGFPLKQKSLDAFDFLIVAFLNIGNFYGKNNGLTGSRQPELFTLPNEFVGKYLNTTWKWQKVMLKGLESELEPFKGDLGLELIAQKLGIPRPTKLRASVLTIANSIQDRRQSNHRSVIIVVCE